MSEREKERERERRARKETIARAKCEGSAKKVLPSKWPRGVIKWQKNESEITHSVSERKGKERECKSKLLYTLHERPFGITE